MDALQLFKSKGELEFDIGGCISIMGEFFVVVESIVFVTKAQCLVPFESFFLPLLIPFFLCSRWDEELHFHLFEFAHAEDELTGYDFIAKGFSNLCNTKGKFHPSRFLDIEEVDKNSLCGFGPQIKIHGSIGRGTEFGAKHKVELLYVSPVSGA